MPLCIDYINMIMDYDGIPSEYWLSTHAIIDMDNLEESHTRYLELVRIYLPTYSDKLLSIESFKNRIFQYYDRKERGIKYFLDIVHDDKSKKSVDMLNKLRIHTVTTTKKNVGTQLNLNLFD